MNAFLRNRGLWCFAITTLAVALVYTITKPGHRWLELRDGIAFAAVAAVVIGLLVLLVIKTVRKKVEVSILVLIIVAIGVVIISKTLDFALKINVGHGWWNTRGFFACLILIAAAAGCYLLWELHSRPQAQQPARQRRQAQQPQPAQRVQV